MRSASRVGTAEDRDGRPHRRVAADVVGVASTASADAAPYVDGYGPARRQGRQGARRRRPARPSAPTGSTIRRSTRTASSRAGHAPRPTDEVVIDRGTRRRRPARTSATARRCSTPRPASRSRSSASPPSATPTASAGRRYVGVRPRRRPQRAARRSARRARRDPSSPPTPACQPGDAGAARIAAGRRASGVEVITGAELTAEQQRRRSTRDFLDLFRDVPARLRRHRPVRRHVQHLQHVLDHRRPAHAGVGAAAGDRRLPPPGASRRRARGARRRRRRLGDRPRRRYRAGRRPPGAARRGPASTCRAAALVIGTGTIVVAARRRRGHDAGRQRRPGRPGLRVAPLAALRDVAVDQLGGVVAPGASSACSSPAAACAASSPPTSVGRRRPWPGSGSARWACSSASSCSDRSWPGPRPPCSACRWRRCAGWRSPGPANAMRNPRRTAGSAAALMVGVARGRLVHHLRRVGQGVDRHGHRRRLQRRPHRVRRRLRTAAEHRPHVAPGHRRRPRACSERSPVRDAPAAIDGETVGVRGDRRRAASAASFDLGVAAVVRRLGRGDVAVSDRYAAEHHLGSGSTLPVDVRPTGHRRPSRWRRSTHQRTDRSATWSSIQADFAATRAQRQLDAWCSSTSPTAPRRGRSRRPSTRVTDGLATPVARPSAVQGTLGEPGRHRC